MKSFLRRATPNERLALAEKVGSSVNYFYQIAGGHKKPGPKLCKKLVAAEPEFTLAELRPDYWQPQPKPRKQRHAHKPS